MTLLHEFLSEIGNDSFCASVQLGGHTFPERSNLRNFHRHLLLLFYFLSFFLAFSKNLGEAFVNSARAMPKHSCQENRV